MVNFLTGIFILLLIVYVVILILNKKPNIVKDVKEEIKSVVETPVNDNSDEEELPVARKPNIVGNLKREIEGTQAFVFDPIDKQKIWLNSNDDMYEDAQGNIWRLI